MDTVAFVREAVDPVAALGRVDKEMVAAIVLVALDDKEQEKVAVAAVVVVRC